MGVKAFFGGYILKKHKDCVARQRPELIAWDYLLIDLNGIIHTSCAAVYGYGDAAPSASSRLLKRPVRAPTIDSVVAHIMDRLNYLIHLVAPTRGVFIAIDGVAPVSKQCQQRQRRYRASMARDDPTVFDSNSITPGTEFLHNLSYLLGQKLRAFSQHSNLEILLANQNVAGEGEHKAIQFIRRNASANYSYVVYGMDADLINLTLTAPASNIFIVRETRQGAEKDFYWVDITILRERIQTDMFWTSDDGSFADPQGLVRDFVLMCYFLGNDFLPQVKCLNIYEGAIDNMISQYVQFAPEYKHLVIEFNNRWYLNHRLLRKIIEGLQSKEHGILYHLALGKDGRHIDPYMADCLRVASAGAETASDFDYGRYRGVHGTQKLLDKPRDAVLKYLEGMEWIVNYYLKGPISWTWYYPYHYAPLLSHFLEHMDAFQSVAYPHSRPHAPVQQLLSVLPPRSSDLLPDPFRVMIHEPTFGMKAQFPALVEVDLGCCKNDWEATVLCPFVDQRSISKFYLDNSYLMPEDVKKRNQPGRVFRYARGTFMFVEL